MKKLFLLFFSITLLSLSLASCGRDNRETNGANAQKVEQLTDSMRMAAAVQDPQLIEKYALEALSLEALSDSDYNYFLINLSYAHMLRNDKTKMDSCLSRFMSANSNVEDPKERGQLALAYNCLASYYGRCSQHDSAIFYYKRCYEYSLHSEGLNSMYNALSVCSGIGLIPKLHGGSREPVS